MVDLIADGLQVALLWKPRQQSLHAAVELLFTVKLGGKREEDKTTECVKDKAV